MSWKHKDLALCTVLLSELHFEFLMICCTYHQPFFNVAKIRQTCALLTGKSLNMLGRNSMDLLGEENGGEGGGGIRKEKVKWKRTFAKPCLRARTEITEVEQLAKQSARFSSMPIGQSLTSLLQVAVTLSTTLINYMLTLGGEQLGPIFCNSWAARRQREGLSMSQLTISVSASHSTWLIHTGCTP